MSIDDAVAEVFLALGTRRKDFPEAGSRIGPPYKAYASKKGESGPYYVIDLDSFGVLHFYPLKEGSRYYNKVKKWLIRRKLLAARNPSAVVRRENVFELLQSSR
ncbi:hypothetical protein HY212_04365 [Candidatus Pacearchaeota archaeon]|nr:hypothetical protein [Candidatus Pacearchaeota archaeon]